jgi:integrase
MSTDALEAHLNALRDINRRPGTIAQREYALRRLERFAGKPLLELDTETLRAWINQPQLGTEARAGAVSHARGFYRWAMEEGLITVDPTARLRRPKRERRLPRPMADDRAAKALTAAESPIREWLYLAAYAGLRACEIAPLKGEDLLLRQRPPMIVIRESKGGDTTAVPISSTLLPVLLALPERGWCFPSGPGGRRPHVSAGQVSKRSNAYLRDLGIPDTLHSLRHWFGTATYRATGRDLRTTQELMRHRSPTSTAIYTFVDPGEAARALDHLPSLAG